MKSDVFMCCVLTPACTPRQAWARQAVCIGVLSRASQAAAACSRPHSALEATARPGASTLRHKGQPMHGRMCGSLRESHNLLPHTRHLVPQQMCPAIDTTCCTCQAGQRAPVSCVGAARAAASYRRASMRKSVGKNTSAVPRGSRYVAWSSVDPPTCRAPGATRSPPKPETAVASGRALARLGHGCARAGQARSCTRPGRGTVRCHCRSGLCQCDPGTDMRCQTEAGPQQARKDVQL